MSSSLEDGAILVVDVEVDFDGQAAKSDKNFLYFVGALVKSISHIRAKGTFLNVGGNQ